MARPQENFGPTHLRTRSKPPFSEILAENQQSIQYWKKSINFLYVLVVKGSIFQIFSSLS